MNLRAHPRLLKEHWTQISEIDKARFGINDYHSAFVDHAKNHPEMYTILTLNDSVIGYGLVVPTTLFAKEAIKRGEMDENELLKDHVVSLRDSDSLYLASVATAVKTKPILSSRLVGLVGGSVLRAEKPVFAVSVSDQGEEMSREIGMQELAYKGPFVGINNHHPKYFEKSAFKINP